MKTTPLIFAAVTGAIGVTPAGLADSLATAPPTSSAALQLPVEGKIPFLDGAVGWLNSPALTPDALKGKVVLVNFWTLSCINWIRTVPYVRAWAARYRDHGLVVIGVHSPEFTFEKNVGDVRRAVKEMRIEYPIAIDSNLAIWRAFENAYWPALYFVDGRGRIRHHHFGEGDYERSETVLRQLLAEAASTSRVMGPVSVMAHGAEAAPDWDNARSPETYVGTERATNFASPGGAVSNKPRSYMAPVKLKLNQWALSGTWTMGGEAIVANEPNGRIVFRFHSRDLHLVMGVGTRRTSVRIRVLIDGNAPGASHGVDVDEAGMGTVSDRRLYQLIRQTTPIVDRVFEIEFLDPGVEAFSFTFG